MTLGEKIKKQRLSMNMTQDDLAAKLYVSDKTISKWETNRSKPDDNLLKKLCIELQLDEYEVKKIIAKELKEKNGPFIPVLLDSSHQKLIIFLCCIIPGLLLILNNFLIHTLSSSYNTNSSGILIVLKTNNTAIMVSLVLLAIFAIMVIFAKKDARFLIVPFALFAAQAFDTIAISINILKGASLDFDSVLTIITNFILLGIYILYILLCLNRIKRKGVVYFTLCLYSICYFLLFNIQLSESVDLLHNETLEIKLVSTINQLLTFSQNVVIVIGYFFLLRYTKNKIELSIQ